MTENRTSEADRHLLDQVIAGDENGWRVLVGKYHGRLLAFARSKLGAVDRSAVAEDLVQEAFVSFIAAAKTYRGECSLESFLFRILRYRINDHFRSRGQTKIVSGCEVAEQTMVAADLTASQHVAVHEERLAFERALTDAVFQVTNEMKQRKKFRDLKVAEGLFFAGLPNQKIAALLGASENEIGVVKHRLVKRMQASVSATTGPASSHGEIAFLPNLRVIWDDLRPSCPKRTTLGKYVLEILPPDWTDFVRFHVDQLGCDYCRANMGELEQDANSGVDSPLQQQLFQSTIGFLKRP